MKGKVHPVVVADLSHKMLGEAARKAAGIPSARPGRKIGLEAQPFSLTAAHC